MTDLAHGIWAGAVATLSIGGARVAITWLNQRERKNIRDEFRDERDKGVTSRVDELEAELKAMRVEQKTFLANQRAR